MTTKEIRLTRTLDEGVRAELHEKEGGSPEIFIDGAWGAILETDGIFKLNLFTRGISVEEGVERREIAARIVMTTVTLAQLAKYLNDRVQDTVQMAIALQQQAEATQEKSKPAKTGSKKARPKKRRRSKAKSK